MTADRTPRPAPARPRIAIPSRRGVLASALGAGVAAVAMPAPAWGLTDRRPGSVRAPALSTTDRSVLARVDSRRALEHIRVLSEDIGPRIGGTASEKTAADYLAAQLDGFGFETEQQPFGVADKFLADIEGVGTDLPDDLCWQAGASPQGGLDVEVTGPVVDVGPGTTYPPTAAGAVVLVDLVTAQVDAQVAAAVAAGAVAVVLLPADSVAPRQTSARSVPLTTPVAVPVVGVAQSQKQRLRDLAAAGPLTLRVSTVAHRDLTSYNVLAERRPVRDRGTAAVVMVSAHYDSVIGAPGANDDGSGTALCIELARVLRGLPTTATIRFGLWGSEEQGLIGSRYYVAQLPQDERDRIHAVFQNDMVATSWDPATRYWQLSFTGEGNNATDGVSDAAARLGYEARISPVTERGASDHQSFQEVGIASANFSWRGEESPALLEPPYHSPLDTIANNISLERLQVSLELIGAATYAAAGRTRPA